MLAPAAPFIARLRLVMLVAVLAMGSVMGLLLAHAEDAHHAVESSGATVPTQAHDAASAAAWWLGEAVTTAEATGDSEPIGDVLAFCMALATCFAALIALFGMRVPTRWRLLALSVVDPPAWPRLRVVPALRRPLLSVYRI